jgi:UDP-N-acetylglucosamine 2-epimerase (non-hydrolysing)
LSEIFFQELGLPEPDVNLEVGSGSHAQQTAEVMRRIEPVLLEFAPDWVVVPGDVNSTLAAALTAAKLGQRVVHVEAGLRSFDRSMPEEINRVLTDRLSDLLLTPSRDGDANLVAEGIPAERIHMVGNVMIDTLVRLWPKAEARWPQLAAQLPAREYVLVTLHRPGNVDHPQRLQEFLRAMEGMAAELPVVFPVHPRTRERLRGQAWPPPALAGRLHLLEPQGYLEFLALQSHAALVLTDSGGVQEETTYLGVRCLTARPNTERPVTITHGTNRLVAADAASLIGAARAALAAGPRPGRPELWDGHAAERIAALLTAQPPDGGPRLASSPSRTA